MKNVCLIVFQNFTKIHQNFNEKWKKSAKNLLYKLGYLRIYKNVILKTSCSRFLFGYKVQSIYWNLRSYVNMLYSKDVILADFHFSFLAHFLSFPIKCLIKIILFFAFQKIYFMSEGLSIQFCCNPNFKVFMQVQLIEVKVRNLNWIFLYWKHIITHYLLQCFLAAWKNMFKETVCVTSSYSSGKDGPALVTAIPLSCTMCLFVFNSHNPGYMFSCDRNAQDIFVQKS